MAEILDPILAKDMAEAKAALARHGIVIIRYVETDLEPAVMAEVKNSISSSPGVLRGMDEGEFEKLMEGLRKAAMKSSKDLVKLHTRLLAQLGTERVEDLVKELDGINTLFTWKRVSKAIDPVNKKLVKAGFDAIHLSGAEAVSDAFALELNERWPVAFDRFRGLARKTAKKFEVPPTKTPPTKKAPPKKVPPKKRPRKSGKKR